MDPTSPQAAAAAAAAAQQEFEQQFGQFPAPGAADTGRSGNLFLSLALLVVLLVFFGPAYLRHMLLSSNPELFNDDARQQIWPMVRYYDDRLFPSDAIAEYYLDCLPIGFKAIYAALSPVWDARTVSKVLPYILLFVTALGAGRAARRLRGPPAGWAAAALCLGAQIYISRMAGGLPRSFAFPCLAIGAWALCRGRPVVLAFITVFAAAFYPAVAVVTGLCLAGWMFLPARWLGKDAEWSWPRRLIVLGVAGILTVAAALPMTLSANEWGPTLSPADADRYPELSATGRYQGEDRADEAFSLRALKNFIDAPLAGIGGKWDPADPQFKFVARQMILLVLLIGGIAGFAMLVRTSPAARRMLLLPASALIAYVAAVPLVPLLYLPSRYQLYPLAMTALVIVPAGLAHLATVIFKYTAEHQRRTQSLALLATVGLYLLFFSAWSFVGGKERGLSSLSSAGLYFFGENAEAKTASQVTTSLADHRSAFAFLKNNAKPADVVAGWPPDMDSVPYVTNLSALVTREGHQSFHEKYVNEMRDRTYALIDALYSPNLQALFALRDVYRVRYLIITDELFDPKDPPKYFAPFDKTLEERRKALADLRTKPMVLRTSIPLVERLREYRLHPNARRDTVVISAIVFDEAGWIILDLNHPTLKRRQ